MVGKIYWDVVAKKKTRQHNIMDVAEVTLDGILKKYIII